jgi:uncharacterized SAM-binding protein YcdF (DUF218 family)
MGAGWFEHNCAYSVSNNCGRLLLHFIASAPQCKLEYSELDFLQPQKGPLHVYPQRCLPKLQHAAFKRSIKRRGWVAQAMMHQTVIALGKRLWDYLHLEHPLAKADCILALGSHDITVAQHAAQLWLQGWAPLLLCSGGLGRITQHIWNKPEADIFAERAHALGVPQEHILIENKSTNTGENIQFTRALLAERGMTLTTIIVVNKPSMGRRTLATMQQQWPEVHAIITAPSTAYEQYTHDDTKLQELLNIMVGDLQRIQVYPERGFQKAQVIPSQVLDAYQQLVDLGYTKHLIQ